MSDQYWHMGGLFGLAFRVALRTAQLVFAVIVAALYGIDLAQSTKARSSTWIFAEVAAALSILTCAVHCFVTVKHVAWCLWDWVVCVLWAAQFGIFGSTFLGNTNPERAIYTQSVVRMNVAVWISLINMLLWFTTAIGGLVWCCTARKITRKTDKLEMGDQVRVESTYMQLNRQAMATDPNATEDGFKGLDKDSKSMLGEKNENWPLQSDKKKIKRNSS